MNLPKNPALSTDVLSNKAEGIQLQMEDFTLKHPIQGTEGILLQNAPCTHTHTYAHMHTHTHARTHAHMDAYTETHTLIISTCTWQLLDEVPGGLLCQGLAFGIG